MEIFKTEWINHSAFLFAQTIIFAPYVDVCDRSFELLLGCKCCTRGVTCGDSPLLKAGAKAAPLQHFYKLRC